MSEDISKEKEDVEEVVEPVEELVEEEVAAAEEPPSRGVPGPKFLTLDRIFSLCLLGAACVVFCWVLKAAGIRHSCLLAFTLWVGAAAIFVAVAARKHSVTGKAVVITGCDSGFGHTLALHLHSMGMTVFALCLSDGDGAASLRASGSDALHVVIADVTKPDQLKRAREQVEDMLPKGVGLWGLVNNAGVAAYGDVGWVTLATYKRISDVNVFGMISATQVFLPLIRKTQGRVINVASLMGRVGVPMMSPYVLTKFAVEGLSDCLRVELKESGVAVVVVEPGNFFAGTNLLTDAAVEASATSLWDAMSEDVRTQCGEAAFQEKIEFMKHLISSGDTDITSVTDAFVSALLDKFPQARYQPAGLLEKLFAFVAAHCPECCADAVLLACIRKFRSRASSADPPDA